MAYSSRYPGETYAQAQDRYKKELQREKELNERAAQTQGVVAVLFVFMFRIALRYVVPGVIFYFGCVKLINSFAFLGNVPDISPVGLGVIGLLIAVLE